MGRYKEKVAAYRYDPQQFGAGEGNRTLAFGLEGRCSTIELHPHI